MTGGTLRSDLQSLLNLGASLASLRQKKVQVGIFGAKSDRLESGKLRKSGGHRTVKGTSANVTNPELGAIHELGSASRGIAPRSFLRMPLMTRFPKIAASMKKEGQLLAQAGKGLLFMKRVGIAAEKVVLEAFASKGWGAWKPIKEATAKRKHSDAILIDTGQLRRAIAWRVQ